MSILVTDASMRCAGALELDTYEKLVKVQPGHPDAWFRIGEIHRKGTAGVYPDPEKAEAAYRRQIEMNPEHWGARTLLGAVLRSSGKTDEAIALLEPVVNTPNPYQRKALQELATVYQMRREFDRAENLFVRYIPIFQTWQQMNPRTVIRAVASKTPEVYRQDFASAPLDFFFGTGRFKGETGTTDLEIYYGIPLHDLSYTASSLVRLKRGIALIDEHNRPVHRSIEDMTFRKPEMVDTTRTTFIPALDRVSVAPGTYRLSVQVLDTESDKSQVYHQQIVVEPFGDETLALSDIEMAALIRPGKGSRFTKGNVEVVPNPSLAYLPGQPVYIYYEIYNLQKDEFGSTRYRVSYEVRSIDAGQVKANVLRALGKLLGIRKEGAVVTVEYEHVGNAVDDIGYLQLDLTDTEPGEQILSVRVTDEVSGQTVVRKTRFTVK